MEISAEKTKPMTNNTNGISSAIRIGGQNLETVQIFKYLGSDLTDEGSKQEILSRIAQTIDALSKLKTIWKDFFCGHFLHAQIPKFDVCCVERHEQTRLMSSLVISIFLYARETWSLTAESERKIQATEMRCLRKLMGIFNGDCVTNEEVRSSIRHAIGPYKDRIATVRKRKLRWYELITRST